MLQGQVQRRGQLAGLVRGAPHGAFGSLDTPARVSLIGEAKAWISLCAVSLAASHTRRTEVDRSFEVGLEPVVTTPLPVELVEVTKLPRRFDWSALEGQSYITRMLHSGVFFARAKAVRTLRPVFVRTK